MDATFLAHSGRKRKIAKQDREHIEKRVREVPETSIKQVQHWFLTETGETVCRETMRKFMKMLANPSKRRERISCRTHTRSDAWIYEAQDRGGARRSMFERQQVDAQVFNENDTPNSRQLRVL